MSTEITHTYSTISEFSEIRFLDKYRESLNATLDRLQEIDPDIILARSRKAPRILELLRLTGLWTPDIPIISEKAIDFMPPSELQGKSLVLFDDIIVSGTTIENLADRIIDKYDADLHVVTVAVDADMIAIGEDDMNHINVDGTAIPFSHHLPLTKSQRFEFSKKLVQSFIFLNKPYDVDHSIFYTNIGPRTNETIRELDATYDITTLHQRSNGFSRFSLIEDETSVGGFVDSILANATAKSNLQKVRIYYNSTTGECAFVPIVLFSMHRSQIDAGPIFANGFEWCDEIVDEARKQVEYSVSEQALYRLIWYLVTYLYGLHFQQKYKNRIDDFRSFEAPSQSLRYQDLYYLFGPAVTKELLDQLDAHFEETVDTLDELSFGNDDRAMSESKAKTVVDQNRSVQPIPVTEERWWDEDLDDYIDEYVDGDELFASNLATLFEALYLKREIPEQQKYRRFGTDENAHERLTRGYNYEQIVQILTEKGVLSTDDQSDLNSLSLSIDYLVDAGVQIPIFTTSENGVLERVYRYGEDAMSVSSNNFRYIVTRATQYLFDTLDEEMEDNNTIQRIQFEKFGVLMLYEIQRSDLTVEFLDSLSPDDSTAKIAPQFNRHGKVLNIEDNKYSTDSPQELLFTEWCEREEIVQSDENGRNVVFNDEIIDENAKLSAETFSESDTDISNVNGLAMLVPYLIAIADRRTEYSRSHDILTTITTCGDLVSFFKAVRREFVLLYEGGKYNIHDALEEAVAAIEDGGIEEKQQIEDAYKQSGKPRSAGAAIGNKHKLWKYREKTYDILEEEFSELPLRIRNDYDTHLAQHVEELQFQQYDPTEPKISTEMNRLLTFGKTSSLLTHILRATLDVGRYIARARVRKDGELYEQSKKAILSRVETLDELLSKWNDSIVSGEELSYNAYSLDDLEGLPRASDRSVFVQRDGSGQRFLTTIINELETNYELLHEIYVSEYTREPWEQTVRRLFGLDEDDFEYIATDYEWLIWYDIKDSSGKLDSENEKRSDELVVYLNEQLQKLEASLDDGEMEPESENDEKFIAVKNQHHVTAFIKQILMCAREYEMFVRVGVSSVRDRSDAINRHEDGYLASTDTHTLSDRIGSLIEDDDDCAERYDCHTVSTSNQVEHQIGEALIDDDLTKHMVTEEPTRERTEIPECNYDNYVTIRRLQQGSLSLSAFQ